jgi:hypothetical protein
MLKNPTCGYPLLSLSIFSKGFNITIYVNLLFIKKTYTYHIIRGKPKE